MLEKVRALLKQAGNRETFFKRIASFLPLRAVGIIQFDYLAEKYTILIHELEEAIQELKKQS